MNSRDKGKRGERDWAAFLREHFDCKDARRGVQYSGGTDSPDVVNGIPGTHAEVKRTERLQLHKAMAQAIADAGSGAVPYVASKRNRDDWLITLRAADLPRLVELMKKAAAASC
tara:strand:- start:11284 stop:11625 length:342 start_codon:yes stop_codon:yes gene_type:complete